MEEGLHKTAQKTRGNQILTLTGCCLTTSLSTLLTMNATKISSRQQAFIIFSSHEKKGITFKPPG